MRELQLRQWLEQIELEDFNQMTYTEQLIGILSEAMIRSCVEFEGIAIVPKLSKNGCSGCVFQTEEKANGCSYKSVCIAHLRKDKNSIVFTRKAE